MSNLTPTQFALVQRVYLESLDLPGDERDDFVREQLASEPQLLDAYRVLPNPTEIPTAFLEPGVMGINAASHFKEDDSKWRDPQRIGPDIGRFHLLSLLGEGGFGMVYEAEQTEPVRRRVAIKIIKPGMDSRAVINRFEAERQALALMDHPCIAKVLDGGTTGPDSGHPGLPYFAMELVRGDPITTFCDRERLTIEERLQLLAQVCDAVQHAHLKGIIHRDIKPSNVLVTFQDGKPCPKIIDFGIAKAIGHGLSENTLFTQRGQLIGTPAYMSPEQAEMSGVDIDTRTDVYSLGVLLYEVLTSTPPFDPESLRSAGYAEMVRIIREVEPPRPSTRLSTGARSGSSAVDAAKVAHSRRAELGSLTRQLRTDLDWVVMKCLQKERDHRYMTAGELAAELRRILAHEPVRAGPPSRLYRSRKFVRRHRQSLGWVSALILVAGGLGALNVAQYLERTSHRRELNRQGLLEIEKALEAVALTSGPGGSAATVESLLHDLLSSFVANVELSQGQMTRGYERVSQNARLLISQSTPTSLTMREQYVQTLLVHAEVLGSLRTAGPGMHDLARQTYQRVIDAIAPLGSAERSTTLTIALAQAHGGIGDMLRATDTAGSEAAYRQAYIEVQTIPTAELAKKPDILRWRVRFARDTGLSLLRQCRLNEAANIIDQDVSDRRILQLASGRGTAEELVARRDLTVGMLTRAELLGLLGDTAGGVAEAEQALLMRGQSLTDLRASNFDRKDSWLPSFERDIATARLILAKLLHQQGNFVAAQDHLEIAYAWINDDRNTNPHDERATRTALLAELQFAENCLATSDARAMDFADRASMTFSDLERITDRPERYDEYRTAATLIIGRVLAAQGQHAEARLALATAATEADALIAKDPVRAEYARIAVTALQELADTEVALADADASYAEIGHAGARDAVASANQILAGWQSRGGLCGLSAEVHESLARLSERVKN